jgi:hypothetical protein
MNNRAILGICLFVMALQSWPGNAVAGYAESETWCESLAPLDKVVIQSNLVLLGRYDGIIDGSFGPATYRALVEFQTQLGFGGEDGVPSDGQITRLAQAAGTVYGELGVSKVEDAAGGIVVYSPTKLLTTSPSYSRGCFVGGDGCSLSD